MSDAVNKPAHYNQGPIECIDAMQQILTPEEFRGFLKGNAFKYLWREKGKNGIEDLRKGKDYYDRLIQSFDESEDQPVIKQSSTTEPPDGWRWLEVGETLQRGDTTNTIEEIPEDWIGIKCAVKHNLLRRNKFEVGEKVVAKDSNEIWEVDSIVNGVYQLRNGSVFFASFPEHLAPYIEDAKPTTEVAVEVTGEVKPPDGWRFLELGEVIRKGDLPWEDGWVYATEPIMLGMALPKHWKPMIRRNQFEVGEKVVHINGIHACVVVECDHEKDQYVIVYNGRKYVYESKCLVPYIEETK